MKSVVVQQVGLFQSYETETVNRMKTKIAIIVLAAVMTLAAVLAWNRKSIDAVEAHSNLKVVAPAGDRAIATTQVKVASPVDGKIREIRVEEGDRLQRGQLIAILENYQQRDGSVVIPDALRPYMGNQSLITNH